MYLDSTQSHRANILHSFIKKQSPAYFDFANVVICEICNGVGLENCGKSQDGGYHWDGKSYCDACFGIGYIGVSGGMKVSESDYMCRNCDSIGCKECNMTGVVDWIAHIMGR